jgi:hypothetical protein
MVIKTNRQCNFFQLSSSIIALHSIPTLNAMYTFDDGKCLKILLEIRNNRQNKLDLSSDRNAVISASL